jgi:hypothetical protein
LSLWAVLVVSLTIERIDSTPERSNSIKKRRDIFMIERGVPDLGFYRNRFLNARGWIAVVMPALFIMVAEGQACGQILHPTGQAPSFEVATIKPSDPHAIGGRVMDLKGTIDSLRRMSQ